jgi:hypothetical protein
MVNALDNADDVHVMGDVNMGAIVMMTGVGSVTADEETYCDAAGKAQHTIAEPILGFRLHPPHLRTPSLNARRSVATSHPLFAPARGRLPALDRRTGVARTTRSSTLGKRRCESVKSPQTLLCLLMVEFFCAVHYNIFDARKGLFKANGRNALTIPQQ